MANSHIRKKKGVRRGRVILILVIVLVLISALVLGGVALWNNFVKPPEIPTQTVPEGMTRPDSVEEGIYNILVVGRDRVGLNTDTILLVSLNTEDDKVNVLSIPRDTYVKGAERKIKKINGAYGRTGKANVDNLLEEIEIVTGIRPDNYVIVDLDGFVELIDAIGGVEVDVPQKMNYDDDAQNLHIHLEKGLQTLNGEDAMGFVRFRHDYAEGDMGRVKAQQIFLKALADKMMSPSQLGNVDKYVNFVQNNLDTELTAGEMLWFGIQLLEMNPATDVQMFILPGEGMMYEKYSYFLVEKEEALEMLNDYFNPYDQKITDIGVIDINSVKKAA